VTGSIQSFCDHIGEYPVSRALRAIERHNTEHVWLVLPGGERVYCHCHERLKELDTMPDQVLEAVGVGGIAWDGSDWEYGNECPPDEYWNGLDELREDFHDALREHAILCADEDGTEDDTPRQDMNYHQPTFNDAPAGAAWELVSHVSATKERPHSVTVQRLRMVEGDLYEVRHLTWHDAGTTYQEAHVAACGIFGAPGYDDRGLPIPGFDPARWEIVEGSERSTVYFEASGGKIPEPG